MSKPGAVGTMLFPGAAAAKLRPVVIVSNALYQQQHLDVIIGPLTSNLRVATTATDYILVDWQQAGLNVPSAFRCYLQTTLPSRIRVIGQLSDRDWQGVINAVRQSFA